MIPAFVDVLTPEDRLLVRCGWCRTIIHKSESHVRIRDFCDSDCAARDLERERRQGQVLDVVLSFTLCGSAALAGLLFFLLVLRGLGVVGPAIHP